METGQQMTTDTRQKEAAIFLPLYFSFDKYLLRQFGSNHFLQMHIQ